MELTAAGRPFIDVPLRHHFGQNIHVCHRLGRHGQVGVWTSTRRHPTPSAEAIASEIGRTTDYRPVAADGAARAAALIAPLL